jgi:hypothetical protein
MPRGKKAEPIVVKTELYNLETDLAEEHDVAADHPEVVAKLEALMKQCRTPSAEFPFPVLDGAEG